MKADNRMKWLALAAACLAMGACSHSAKLKPSGSYVVFFDRGDVRIPSDGDDVLKVIADAYKDGRFSAAAVACSSDNASSDVAANLELTQARAERVKAELVEFGVPAGVVTAVGEGPADPLVPGVTGDIAVSNRRCVITLS